MIRVVRFPQIAAPSPIEIDLTRPPGTGPAKLGAPKRLMPNAVPQITDEPQPRAALPTQAKPSPPKDWVLPGPETKTIETPAPPAPTPGGTADGTGTASTPGGSGAGSGDGVPGGTGDGGSAAAVLSYPKLLNRDEVLANIRRFYPEAERRAGREATVVVFIHIGADGRVGDVDIAGSGGPAFDAAARRVANLMRFSPAMTKAGPTAAKIKQTMMFQLEDE